MSIDSNGVVTNEALARYDAGIKDIIAMRTAEKNPVRYKVVKSTSTGSQTYSFYKKDENDTQFVVDSASDAITVQDSIDSTSKDPVNGVAVAAKFAEQMTTQNINSIIGYTPMDSSIKGAANGVASLDGLGQVPTSQLPLADSYSPTGTKPVTGTVVAAALATLPEPMVFKGTVGTGGTVTSLPTAATSNKGHTYKAITANVTSGSKIGDTFISNGSEWVIIPSGDEPSGTVTQVGINASSGSHLSASGTVNSSGNLTVGVESGYQIPSSSDVSQITTNKTNILYGLQNGVKNVLKPVTPLPITLNGITFTMNADGSIHIKGTATANPAYYFFLETQRYSYISNIYKGYILSGVTNGSDSTYALAISYSDDGATWRTSAKQTTTPITVRDDYNYVIFQLVVYNGATVDATVYPMLCSPEAWALEPNVYRPFAAPNYDLTRLQSEDRAGLVECVDGGAKNLLSIEGATREVNQVTATYNSDGSITTSGTASGGNANFTIRTYTPAEAAKLSGLVLSGCPSGGSTGTWRLILQKNSANYDVYAEDTGNGAVVGTVPSAACVLILQIKSGYSKNATWYPMLCTKAAFGVSQKFVPYRLNYDLVCQNIKDVNTVLEAVL